MFTAASAISEREASAIQGLPADLLSGGCPLVLKNYVQHWPLVGLAKQSDQALREYLLSDYNGRPVHLMRADAACKGRLFYNDDLTGFNFTRSNQALEQVFADLDAFQGDTSSPTLYVGSTAIDSVFPSLRKDNDLTFLAGQSLASIWMGNQTRIAAHYDAPDNIACVVAGERRFTLFPPEQIGNLYVGPIDFTPAGQPASLVDFHAPDYAKYPKFKQAVAASQSAILKPGDALYIPANWWHHVEGLSDFNVLVNHWWRQVENHIGVPNDALLHAILSIRDLPENQRQAWRSIFDHYIFLADDQKHIPDQALGVLGEVTSKNARKLRAMLINKLNR